MGQRVRIEPLRSLVYTSISGSYAAVGTPLTNQCRLICFTNQTDQDMIFSTDASHDMLIVPKASFKLFDLVTNTEYPDSRWVFVPGTQFYVKQVSAPGSGSVYIEVLYGE